MNQIPDVIECVVTGPTSVRLRFRDGFAGAVDLASTLRGPVFEPLKDPAMFRQISVRDGTITWPNGADFCPSVLRYWCELGRVCSPEELDAHFAPPQPAAVS